MKLKFLKRTTTTILCLFQLLALAACSGSAGAETVKSARVITDREGKELYAPEKVEKIISMAPSVTETLIHMGLAEKLVAVDMYSAGLQGLPENLPYYDIMTPDAESIAALNPDIIFASAMSRVDGGDPFMPLSEIGAAITYMPTPSSIQGIKEDIFFIGEITGENEKAREIVAEMERGFERVIAGIDAQMPRKTVYFEVAAAPHICTFGKGVFLNEMLEMLGAENVFAEMEEWVSVSEEAVIQRNPDIILTNVGYIDDPVGEILKRSGWEGVNAVKGGKVFRIDQNVSSRPNEYVETALAQMAEAIYGSE